MPTDKKDFIYECTLRAVQGSFANPNIQASVASMIRTAEKLWQELQDWEAQQDKKLNPEQ